MVRGLRLGNDIPIQFLDSTTQDNGLSTQRSPANQHLLVSTSNTSIRLLRENLLPYPHETAKIIEDLLSMQEQDFGHKCWEQHTHTLLLLETKASSEVRT